MADLPTFGAGAASATMLGGLVWLGRAALDWGGLWSKRKESLEERLQRWQTETVKEVRAENADLREQLETLQERSDRLIVVELCLRLVVVELVRLDPSSPVLVQVGAMLSKALPVDPRVPAEMQSLLDQLAAVPPAKSQKKGKGQ